MPVSASRSIPQAFPPLAPERKGHRQALPSPVLCELIIILGSWQSSAFLQGLSRRCLRAASVISVNLFLHSSSKSPLSET